MKVIWFQTEDFIKRTLWQKLFGVKCPKCGKKMNKELTYIETNHLYTCYDCKHIVRDYGNWEK
jgi:endogenous inhibitor of DNA gyrase (YacG/DUF329 family)